MVLEELINIRETSNSCNVATTILGYYPNAGVNYFLAIAFGLCAIATIVLGIWKRTWSFSTAVGVGCILECAGYVARVLMHDNPCDSAAFQTQVVTIILGPTVICVGLYLTLKHIALVINPSLSRVSPGLLPFFFVPADVSCLVVQAVGGILAVKAGGDTGVKDPELLKVGNRTIIAGICLQVVVLGTFGVVAGDYLLRARKVGKSRSTDAEPWGDRRFQTVLRALIGAYIFIMIRCIYRIAEMAEGWGNHIMQDEPSFIVLESFMMLAACILISIFPPSIYFSRMSSDTTLDRINLPSLTKTGQSENDSGNQTTEEGFIFRGTDHSSSAKRVFPIPPRRVVLEEPMAYRGD